MERLLLLTRLALRNIRRHARRSILTAAAMILGIVLLMVARSLEAGSHQTYVDSAARLGTGHVSLEHPRYATSQDLADRIRREYLALAEERLAALPDADRVRAVLPRITVGGLAQSASSAIPVRMSGVDPDREAPVSFIAEKIVDGRFLEPGDRLAAVVGTGLAERLGVELGSRLVLMAQGADGELESQLVQVTGIFRTAIPEVDRGVVQLPLETVRSWLGAAGDATSLAVLLTSDRRTGEVARALAAELRAAGVPADDVVVQPWWEAMPDLHAQLRADAIGTYIVFLVLLTIVALAVVNTILMAVLYRTREFGVLRALGLERWEVGAMVLLEGTILALASGVIGMVSGIALVLGLWRDGLDFSWFLSEDELAFGGAVMDPVLIPAIQGVDVAAILTIVVGIGILASLYPAHQATRIEVAEAMKSEG